MPVLTTHFWSFRLDPVPISKAYGCHPPGPSSHPSMHPSNYHFIYFQPSTAYTILQSCKLLSNTPILVGNVFGSSMHVGFFFKSRSSPSYATTVDYLSFLNSGQVMCSLDPLLRLTLILAKYLLPSSRGSYGSLRFDRSSAILVRLIYDNPWVHGFESTTVVSHACLTILFACGPRQTTSIRITRPLLFTINSILTLRLVP